MSLTSETVRIILLKLDLCVPGCLYTAKHPESQLIVNKNKHKINHFYEEIMRKSIENEGDFDLESHMFVIS